MYVYKKALPDLEAMLDGMEKRVTAMANSVPECTGTLLFNTDFAEQDYAWADLLVASKMHVGLHAVVTAGLQRRAAASQHGLCLKKVLVEVVVVDCWCWNCCVKHLLFFDCAAPTVDTVSCGFDRGNLNDSLAT